MKSDALNDGMQSSNINKLIMDKLRILRERSETLYAVETELLKSMSVIESLHTWARLQKAFEWQLQQSATMFEHIHRETLMELQVRLIKLAE